MHYGVVDADGALAHYTPDTAAGSAPAPRHGVHRALRDPQRPAAVLGPELLEPKARTSRRFFADMPSRFAVIPRRGSERRHPVVRSRTHVRAALDQRVRRRRRDRARRLLPSASRTTQARRTATAASSVTSTSTRCRARAHRWRFNLATGADEGRGPVGHDDGVRDDQRRARRPAVPLHVQHDRRRPAGSSSTGS